jgi:hypothetical protein
VFLPQFCVQQPVARARPVQPRVEAATIFAPKAWMARSAPCLGFWRSETPPAGQSRNPCLAGIWPAFGRGRRYIYGKARVPIRRLLIAAAILLMHGQSAKALLLWNWSYSGAGVSASGAFTTNDAPDAAGFYRIVGITGTDNGATITGLQPTGTPIPGNEPYAVDNLVSAFEPRLTAHGLGFSGKRRLCQFVLQRLELLRVFIRAALQKRCRTREAGIVLGCHCPGAERSVAHACGSRRPHRRRPIP